MICSHQHWYGPNISDARFRALAEFGAKAEVDVLYLKSMVLYKEDGDKWYVFDEEVYNSHRRRGKEFKEAREFVYFTGPNPFSEEVGPESGRLLLTCESTDAADYTDDVVQLVRDVFCRHNAGFTFIKA